jgi:hypothetical protein
MTSKAPGYFERLLDELKARGLLVPAALSAREPMPLALSTCVDLPIWAASHNYDAAALSTLERAIATTVRSAAYQRALAADLSVRFTLDGESVEAVSAQDRLTAALCLHARTFKDASLAQPSEPPAAKKAVDAAPAKRPTLSLGTLSPQEIERRRAVLAGAAR